MPVVALQPAVSATLNATLGAGIPLLAEALWLALLIAAPPALAAWSVGALLSLLADRIGARDPSLTTFPRIAAALATIALLSPWIFDQALTFGRRAFTAALGLP